MPGRPRARRNPKLRLRRARVRCCGKGPGALPVCRRGGGLVSRMGAAAKAFRGPGQLPLATGCRMPCARRTCLRLRWSGCSSALPQKGQDSMGPASCLSGEEARDRPKVQRRRRGGVRRGAARMRRSHERPACQRRRPHGGRERERRRKGGGGALVTTRRAFPPAAWERMNQRRGPSTDGATQPSRPKVVCA